MSKLTQLALMYFADVWNKGGRLPLLSIRPAITVIALEPDQILLLGDRDTCVWTTCHELLHDRETAGSRTRCEF